MASFRRISALVAVLIPLFLSNPECSADNAGRPGISAGMAWCKVDDPDGFAKLFIDNYGHNSYYLKLAYSTRPGGKFDVYNEILNYPVFGVGVAYDNYSSMEFKNSSRLGDFVDVFGFMEGAFYKNKVLSLGYNLAFGLGATGEYYDPYRNPVEFLVGAPLSVYMSFGPQIKLRPSEHVEVVLNGSWFHHSTGNMSQPNYGLNDFMAGVDLRYNLDAPYTQQVRSLSLPHSFPKGFKFNVYGTFGLHACKTEFTAYNMMVEDPDKKLVVLPARPRVGVAIDAVYRYCQLCSTGLAMDFGYHWDSPMLRDSDTIIYGKKVVDDGPGYSPFNWALGFIHEFHYGNFAAFCGCSRYLFRKVGIHENQARFFQRAGMRFYFPRLSNTFLGMCIRATKFNNADFFEFQMGIRI